MNDGSMPASATERGNDWDALQRPSAHGLNGHNGARQSEGPEASEPQQVGEEIVASRPLVGLVASPLRNESTSTTFHFWVQRDALVERTQLVRTRSTIGGRQVDFYGLVDEVYRRSRKRSFDEEYDTFDGEPDYDPPFGPEGVTFAAVKTLFTEPQVYTPPLEQSPVYLGDYSDASKAYDYDSLVDEQQTDWGLVVGLLRNGAMRTAGTAKIDLRKLNGDMAGHLNITGQAGSGTKSSFLTVVVRSLIDKARELDNGDPGRAVFSVRPIIFNVKGRDLMYIDFPNKSLNQTRRAVWQEMGLEPRPFASAEFYSPSDAGNRAQTSVLRLVGGTARQTRAYYWTLEDIVRFGLWNYLFSDETQNNENMMALAESIIGDIAQDCPPTNDHPAGLRLRTGGPVGSFEDLRRWMQDGLRDQHHATRGGGIFTFATLRALIARLNLVFGREGRQIFDPGPGRGRPLQVIAAGTTDPVVIDIATLPPELRRFVVAAVLDQVRAQQTGERRIPGQVYFIVLDELGIYAPRGASDPITRLFEFVAAQLRSQGIILLGAQQQASKVSETVLGNSEYKVLGATSPAEVESPVLSRLLTGPQKAQAVGLRPDSKMVLTDLGWMNIIVPYPAWAMKWSEADLGPEPREGGGAQPREESFALNLPEDAR